MNFKFIVHQLCEQIGFLVLIIVSAHEYPASQDIRELMSPKNKCLLCSHLFSLETHHIMIRTFGAYRCFATIMIQFVARQLCEHIGSLALITLQKLMHTNKSIRFTDSIAYAILMSQVF